MFNTFNWKTNSEIPNLINTNDIDNILPNRLIVYSKKCNYFGEGFFIDQYLSENEKVIIERHIEKGNIRINWKDITKWISMNEFYENIKDELNN